MKMAVNKTLPATGIPLCAIAASEHTDIAESLAQPFSIDAGIEF